MNRVALSVALAVLPLLAGCSVGRRFMAIDSDSRAPFFGLQLQEKKKSDPVFRSIARNGRKQAEVRVADSRGDRRIVAVSGTIKSAEPPTADAETGAQPLPRTDLGPTSAESLAEGPAVDVFQ